MEYTNHFELLDLPQKDILAAHFQQLLQKSIKLKPQHYRSRSSSERAQRQVGDIDTLDSEASFKMPKKIIHNRNRMPYQTMHSTKSLTQF